MIYHSLYVKYNSPLVLCLTFFGMQQILLTFDFYIILLILQVFIAITGHKGLLSGKGPSTDSTMDILTVPSHCMSNEEVGSSAETNNVDCPA